MYDRDNRSGMSGNHAFDDVTSIKTDQFKLSAREHNLLENHLFTQSQSRESLPPITTSGFTPIDTVDGEIKERMLSQLTMENKTLREEITASKAKVFQLESDLDYLRTTIEKNLPFFNKLEQENKKLQLQVCNRTNREKFTDKLQAKIRGLEKKSNNQQAEFDKSKFKVERENQQLKERLDTATNMNHNLQRKLNISKKKAD